MGRPAISGGDTPPGLRAIGLKRQESKRFLPACPTPVLLTLCRRAVRLLVPETGELAHHAVVPRAALAAERQRNPASPSGGCTT
jgi:hypothetical protein